MQGVASDGDGSGTHSTNDRPPSHGAERHEFSKGKDVWHLLRRTRRVPVGWEKAQDTQKWGQRQGETKHERPALGGGSHEK